MSTDSEVIRRSREAPAEFGELFVRHAAVLHRYVARRVGIDAADDVLSDTFLIAFERRDRFDPAWVDARPWLYGIATNLIRKHHHDEARALKALMAVPREISPTDEDVAVGRRVDAERSFATLSRTLRRMPARDRDTLLLFAWAGLSYEEIAVATNTPVGTVRSRLSRAKRPIRAATPLSRTTCVERNPLSCTTCVERTLSRASHGSIACHGLGGTPRVARRVLLVVRLPGDFKDLVLTR